jgi:hypothetical protein
MVAGTLLSSIDQFKQAIETVSSDSQIGSVFPSGRQFATGMSVQLRPLLNGTAHDSMETCFRAAFVASLSHRLLSG